MLGEKMMFHGWSGILMLVTGIGLVATDPGSKVEEGGGAEDGSGAPPLIIWIGPALVCASAYAFYNIFIKLGSSSINPILGGVILQFVAALFGSVLLLGLSVEERGFGYLNYDKWGLIWSCCAGIAVGTAEMLSFCVSGLGVPATQSIPTSKYAAARYALLRSHKVNSLFIIFCLLSHWGLGYVRSSAWHLDARRIPHVSRLVWRWSSHGRNRICGY